MSSSQVIKNRIDGEDYRVSIAPVHKSVSVQLNMGLSADFDDIVYEAAVFRKRNFFKPLFTIEFDDSHSKRISEAEFTKLIHHLISTEAIPTLMNGGTELFKKYGFLATEHDMWQLFVLSRLRMVFICKDPHKS